MARGFRYVILGAGAQGLAAAYDLALFGHAEKVTLADVSPKLAKEAVAKLKELLGPALAQNGTTLAHKRVKGRRTADFLDVMKGHEGVLSGLPYYLNPAAAAAAIAGKLHYVDLGGHFDTTKEILKLDRKAQRAGVTLTPDCGVSPGLINVLAARGIEQLDRTDDVKLYCGGLPANPHPPLDYKLVFNLEGVLGNYFGAAYILKDGRVDMQEPFSEREELDFSGLGRLEAFVTGGATSTCPWTYEGKIQNYTYKTLRYRGHHEKICLLRDLGLLDTKAVSLHNMKVVPRDLFVKLAEPRLRFPSEKDFLLMRAVVQGVKKGAAQKITFDLMEHDDAKTGFTAMQRTTGFPAAVALEYIVQNPEKKPGVVPIEKLVNPKTYLDEVRRRGIAIKESFSLPTAG